VRVCAEREKGMIVMTIVIDGEAGKISKFSAGCEPTPKEKEYEDVLRRLIDAAFDPSAHAALEKIAVQAKKSKRAKGEKS
jgi:hypothetical protein